MQDRLLFEQITRTWLICGALACALALPASAEITAELKLVDDHNTSKTSDDDWGYLYSLDKRFTLGVGYGLSFVVLDPDGAFEIDDYLTNTGWTVALEIPEDVELGLPAMIDIEATSGAALALVYAPIFNLTPTTMEYTASQQYVVMDPDFEVVESGVVTIPEPEPQSLAAIALLTLAGLVTWRDVARRRQHRERHRERHREQHREQHQEWLRREVAVQALVAALIFLPLLGPAVAEAGTAIVDAPTQSATMGDLEIDFTPFEWEWATTERQGARKFQVRFHVEVTNDGPASNPLSLYATKDDTPTRVTSSELFVPALDPDETFTLADDLVMIQDRGFSYRPGSVHLCAFENPVTNLPDDDPRIVAIDDEIASLNLNKNDPDWKTEVPNPLSDSTAFSCGRVYFWNLSTSHGDMKIRLFHDTAPEHVSNTIYLTRMGFYDDTIFHRMIQGFVAQGGDPLGTGTGGPDGGYGSEFDLNVQHDERGTLSMAHAGEGTDGSQFFLTYVSAHHLDNKHTVFGFIEEGWDTLDALEDVSDPTSSGVPVETVTINSATISVE